MRPYIPLMIVILCLSMLVACNESNKKISKVDAPQQTDLNDIISELPNATGYETFKMNCLSCHSARYIQMQPDLTEKAWSNIVTKMQRSFAAPVTDSSAKEIVQYLTSIKGKK
jgi:hypothetical protein